MKEFAEKLIAWLKRECHRKYGEALRTASVYKQSEIAGFMDGLCFAMRGINQLAEKYKDGWILCSERLPEEGKKVLTCTEDGWISVNIYISHKEKKNDFESGYYVAWMPLPEPYKRQS